MKKNNIKIFINIIQAISLFWGALFLVISINLFFKNQYINSITENFLDNVEYSGFLTITLISALISPLIMYLFCKRFKDQDLIAIDVEHRNKNLYLKISKFYLFFPIGFIILTFLSMGYALMLFDESTVLGSTLFAYFLVLIIGGVSSLNLGFFYSFFPKPILYLTQILAISPILLSIFCYPLLINLKEVIQDHKIDQKISAEQHKVWLEKRKKIQVEKIIYYNEKVLEHISLLQNTVPSIINISSACQDGQTREGLIEPCTYLWFQIELDNKTKLKLDETLLIKQIPKATFDSIKKTTDEITLLFENTFSAEDLSIISEYEHGDTCETGRSVCLKFHIQSTTQVDYYLKNQPCLRTYKCEAAEIDSCMIIDKKIDGNCKEK